ncbi:MAG TPA: ADP-ribosylglycohydrolase family protein, partial [Thermoanaerobaculia bacterium]|nr:ADP-ribosylglycohydrolase family protein [Thermoanaerobaculia bacterium]
MSDVTYLDRVRGCLLGGALGDALGAPIEFLSLGEIRERFGSGGLRHLERAYGRVGAITDDTQMTLFTAEGLIRAWVRGDIRGIGHPPSVVHHAYLRWLHTQGVPWKEVFRPVKEEEPDGWLVREKWLHARRAPGRTCMSALRQADGLGAPARNDSKGCGGVMRVAPVGLLPHAGTGAVAISRGS